MSTLRRTARIGAIASALVISAILGGTLIGAVAARTMPSSPSAPAANLASVGDPAAADPTAPAANDPAAPGATDPAAPANDAASQACATFRAAFAAKLGVTTDALTEAAKSAIDTTINSLVAKGTLGQPAADRLKARVDAADGQGCALLSGWRGRLVRAALTVVQDAMSAAATTLHMTPKDLRAQLAAGQTLPQIATAQHVAYADLSAAITTAVKTDLDNAVKAGTITQDREDAILARLADRLAAGRLRG